MTVLLSVAAVVIAYYLLKSVGGMTMPLGPSLAVQKIAQAIAYAEGFYSSDPTVRPRRNHNPGDMTEDLIGKKTGVDGPFVVYSNDQDGWDNLYKQVQMWLDGTSKRADGSFTIDDIAQFYTTTDQPTWAQNVANQLGVSVDTQIQEVT